MNPVKNPYAPGAGSRPPQLAGRDELREQIGIALQRTLIGKQSKSLIMVGLRGVGKTVLLDQFRDDAEAMGIYTLRMEAPEKRSLPALLAPQLRKALLRISRSDKARDMASRALRALTGFAKGLKLKFNDIEVALDFDAEPGLADNGDLEHDLSELMEASGLAAQQAGTALALLIDELQYVEEDQLAALITALHRCAQSRVPVIFIGAGLPQIRGKMGDAKSYAERLFVFPELEPLSREHTAEAISIPAAEEGVIFETAALDAIYAETQGYPYFLQEWAKHAWDISSASPITREDVRRASIEALAALDAGFFRVRFARLTPSEKVYLRAMADLGPGPHRSGDIAEKLHKSVTGLAPLRAQLIHKGMIWSPGHGDTAFTVPLFDEYMKRIMPGHAWEKP